MKISKTINLEAFSSIPAKQIDGSTVEKNIASFSATISDSYTSSQLTIQDQDLYNANKAQVRKDKATFDDYVYNLQDTLFATEGESTESTEANQ